MLAEAMCVHFSFIYAPSSEHYWMQGRSSETDFIYVTTNSLTHEQLEDNLGGGRPDERTLLICCKAFQGAKVDKPLHEPHRSARYRAQMLDRCEWGKDDYSLKIANSAADGGWSRSRGRPEVCR